ncbi:hypothetical protein BAUCODRAFT_36708 [Baudoinia panamericana UAMH 10762]|uniref:Uncharacterized protein n=1 Tax=Baudoinia panamericana (strain UAMH 10762) TaxID=717646 RepID=M2N630_BAUPA|nr:uncharacterized protein BAUCODRAFT_36708 [Baudoinia panamericana UAMH 10762]EMC94240.1 hypothetical protein BAUCODRAFT_36708 [Baudoinia panamericana UAMH 10762]
MLAQLYEEKHIQPPATLADKGALVESASPSTSPLTRSVTSKKRVMPCRDPRTPKRPARGGPTHAELTIPTPVASTSPTQADVTGESTASTPACAATNSASKDTPAAQAVASIQESRQPTPTGTDKDEPAHQASPVSPPSTASAASSMTLGRDEPLTLEERLSRTERMMAALARRVFALER